MIKKVLIIFVILFSLFVAVVIFFVYNQKPQDLSRISETQIIARLKENSDAKEYMQNNPDFKINNKEILTKESIIAGQNGPNFKEVYQGLELQNGRYMRIDLINQAGDRGLIAVIDFKKQTVLKAYGIILLKSNGQTTTP